MIALTLWGAGAANGSSDWGQYAIYNLSNNTHQFSSLLEQKSSNSCNNARIVGSGLSQNEDVLFIENPTLFCRGGDTEIPSRKLQDISNIKSQTNLDDSSGVDVIVNANIADTERVDFASDKVNINAHSKPQIIDASISNHASNRVAPNIYYRGQSNHPTPNHPSLYSPRPRMIIEFDTSCSNGNNERGNSIRSRIQSRIETHEWNEMPHRINAKGPTLSISLDAFAPPTIPSHRIENHQRNSHLNDEDRTDVDNDENQALLTTLLLPVQATITILTHTAILLPSLLVSRRVLNSTWNALVDYFRGRYFRTTFTRMERAYLRYYEFPAVTRAVWRTVSQMGILLGLSWVIRWWMIMALTGNGLGFSGPMTFWLNGIGVETGPGRGEAGFESVWKMGLPCQSQTTGMAMLCGLIWIGAVVGTGHACAMAVSFSVEIVRILRVFQYFPNID